MLKGASSGRASPSLLLFSPFLLLSLLLFLFLDLLTLTGQESVNEITWGTQEANNIGAYLQILRGFNLSDKKMC